MSVEDELKRKLKIMEGKIDYLQHKSSDEPPLCFPLSIDLKHFKQTTSYDKYKLIKIFHKS